MGPRCSLDYAIHDNDGQSLVQVLGKLSAIFIADISPNCREFSSTSQSPSEIPLVVLILYADIVSLYRFSNT